MLYIMILGGNMNERIKELAKKCWDQRLDGQLHFDNEQFAALIVQACGDYIRENMNTPDAEPLAFCMERDFGLHGDYAE